MVSNLSIFSDNAFDILERDHGLFFEFGKSSMTDSFSWEVGGKKIISEYLSTRFGFMYIDSDSLDEEYAWLWGVNGGFRINVNHPISPFIGLGVFWGDARFHYSQKVKIRENVNLNVELDLKGQKKEIKEDDTVVSLFPEIGTDIWLKGNLSLSFLCRYYFVSEGRDFDFWLYNCGLTYHFF